MLAVAHLATVVVVSAAAPRQWGSQDAPATKRHLARHPSSVPRPQVCPTPREYGSRRSPASPPTHASPLPAATGAPATASGGCPPVRGKWRTASTMTMMVSLMQPAGRQSGALTAEQTAQDLAGWGALPAATPARPSVFQTQRRWPRRCLILQPPALLFPMRSRSPLGLVTVPMAVTLVPTCRFLSWPSALASLPHCRQALHFSASTPLDARWRGTAAAGGAA